DEDLGAHVRARAFVRGVQSGMYVGEVRGCQGNSKDAEFNRLVGDDLEFMPGRRERDDVGGGICRERIDLQGPYGTCGTENYSVAGHRHSTANKMSIARSMNASTG